MPVGFWAYIVGSLAVLLRLVGLGPSQDMFIDEPLYVALGHSVRSGGFPMVNGGRFFLHPPGFFYLEAAWERLFGFRPDVVAGVYEMRALNAVLAGATAAALIVLVARATSLWPAVATGALFALEPFCLRQNGRVLLETAMMFWVVVGYVVLLPLAKAHPPSRHRLRTKAHRDGTTTVVVLDPMSGTAPRDYMRAACAGVLLGLAVLTKDEAALVTVLPLLAAALLGWGPPRRLSLLAACVATLAYGSYVAVVAMSGDWGEFWSAKSTGLLRLLGFIQVTGFNAPGAPSLTSRLMQESMFFGTTYALLAASSAAFLFLVRRGTPAQRLVALLYASSAVALGYAVLLGTIEEQELYVLAVPALAVLGVGAGMLLKARATAGAALRRIGLPLFALIMAVNINTYVSWHIHPDDGYVRLRHYLAGKVRTGSTIITPDGSQQGIYWILRDRYDVVPWVSPQEQVREQAHYMVVDWTEVDDHYAYLSPSEVRSLTAHAVPLFSFHGRTYSRLILYRLPFPDRAGAG
jgi:4-amino-4-deoxy-L-arabinose transferase-like glycosyltransferase